VSRISPFPWSRLAWLIVLAAVGASCRDGRAPNVLVIVVDTLRADRLGAYGNTRGLTPFLDELAQRGTVFMHAYAPSSWTIPSVASMLTSRYASQHHVFGFGARLPPQEVTFAEAMEPLRYIAGGFSANHLLLERLGYAQGFQHWYTDEKALQPPSAAALRRQALEWLDGAWDSQSAQPALLYFQFMEPHTPYDPPEPHRSHALAGVEPQQLAIAMAAKYAEGGGKVMTREDLRGFERLYDGEVATVDAEIKILFEDLERRGFLRDSVILITADHGEEFLDHGGLSHGRALYEESVRVPLILIAPGFEGGRRVMEPVSLVDIAPTLTDLLDLPVHSAFEGRSLVPLLASTSLTSGLSAWLRPSRSIDRTDIILQLKPKTGRANDDRKHVLSIVRGPNKLVIGRDGADEAYDLAADPLETRANPDSLRPMTSVLASALADTETSLARRAGAVLRREPLDAATKEKLRALGYQP